MVIEDPDAAPVMFKVQATLTEFNAVSIVVPAQVTTSPGCRPALKQFKQARLDQNLPSMLPATSPGYKTFGDQAVADLYIFQTPSMRRRTSWVPFGTRSPCSGQPLPQAISFEEAMEQVRGHYRIDLNDTSNPDTGAIGFADESGVHSKQYRRIFRDSRRKPTPDAPSLSPASSTPANMPPRVFIFTAYGGPYRWHPQCLKLVQGAEGPVCRGPRTADGHLYTCLSTDSVCEEERPDADYERNTQTRVRSWGPLNRDARENRWEAENRDGFDAPPSPGAGEN